MTFHSDHSTLHDLLDRKKLIVAKAEKISTCEPPQVFGIHGDWGSGKTSYLEQLRYHLDGQMPSNREKPAEDAIKESLYDTQIITIWFDAWRYQHEKTPVIALLHEIRKQFSIWDEFKNKTAKLAEVGIRSILNSFADVAKLISLESLPINVKEIEKTGEKWEKEHLENKLGADTVQAFLESAIDSILKSAFPRKSSKGERKIVIFIDDLDRCTPESAFRLLEGLKVYLSLKNCVFVLGMNQKIINHSIAKQLPDDAPNSIKGEAYLEKICNSIERLHPYKNSNKLLLNWINDDNFKGLIEKALQDEDGNEIICLPPNPRKLKSLANLINSWKEVLPIAAVENNEDQVKILIAIAYVYQFHAEIFQRWQFTPSFYGHLQKWLQGVLALQDSDKKALYPYFSDLELPESKKTTNEEEATISTAGQFESRFPDPYSANVFWIAPLFSEIEKSNIHEREVTSVLQIITKGDES